MIETPPMALSGVRGYRRSMGYILVAVIAVVFLALFFVALARSSKRTPRGTLEKSVTVEKPAADETTPGASAISSTEQAEQASRHTPPA